MSKRDYYEVLGVQSDATPDVIKKSFRKIALESHPDRNPGDSTAADRFKEANEAFSVLSDPQKREMYDKHGHSPPPGVDMSEVDWSSFFSEFGGFDPFVDMFGLGSEKRKKKQRRNSDIQVRCQVTLTEAMLGCKKEFEYFVEQTQCELCEGTGTKSEHRKKCNQCNGHGKISARQGFMVMTAPCGACSARGFMSSQPCDGCNGDGILRKTAKLSVVIPRGIADGQTLKVPGKGEASFKDTPTGDLYVCVAVKNTATVGDLSFKRDGSRLRTRVKVNAFDVMLGTSFDVELPSGEHTNVVLPRGHQPKNDIVVKDHGMHVLGTNNRGDLIVILDVAFPVNVDDEIAQALQLAKERCGC